MNMIRAYKENTGAAIIIVSHSMEDVAALCEKLLVLSNGQAVMFDTTENVFSQYESLINNGLDLPSVAKIFKELHKLGYLQDKMAYTVGDAKRIIIDSLKGGAL